MNWIIKNRDKLRFHTNLNVLLKPIENDIQRFNWLINDLEINSSELESLPINHEQDWFLITSEQMEELRISDTQIVWGAFSAIDNKSKIEIKEDVLPYAEGVSEIWKNGNLQVKESEIEIIAWDSSFTIVKFTDQTLSEKFSNYFDEAIELEKYKWKKSR
ncbi:hypothetical protein [Portibacter marinus]|uniref:hypothetical protein n=1 Tax=Portibacter marinus TaxID=2898660 RepID=UPI001F3753A0|nr:hypothetical protein [Portibacter marinus]